MAGITDGTLDWVTTETVLHGLAGLPSNGAEPDRRTMPEPAGAA